MAWDLTGVRRGTLDEQGCDGLKVQIYSMLLLYPTHGSESNWCFFLD